MHRDPADVPGVVSPWLVVGKLRVEPGDEAATGRQAGQWSVYVGVVGAGHDDCPELLGKPAQHLEAPPALLPRSHGVASVVLHPELVGAMANVAEAVEELGAEAGKAGRVLGDAGEGTLVLGGAVVALGIHDLQAYSSQERGGCLEVFS